MMLDESNKLKRKPIQHSDKIKFKQSYYHPDHPEKCITQINECRSSWEQKFCWWCDHNPNILHWASEPIGIKYLDPAANIEYCMKHNINPQDPHNWKMRTYYVDFWIEEQDMLTGELVRTFIEVKPYHETIEPKPILANASLKEHKAYNKAALTYITNKAKWDTAERVFAERGCKFKVITEKDLKDLKLL